MTDKTSSKTRTRLLTTGIILTGSLVFAFLMELVPWMSQVERATYDAVFAIRPHLLPAKDLVIVSLDESSQKELGPLPWPRTVYAALLKKLKEGGAKMAVFDMLFDQPKDPETGEDQAFALAIAEFGHVVLGKEISRTSDPQFAIEETIEPLEIFYKAGATGGFVSTPSDPDTKIRRANWTVRGQTTLVTEAYKRYTGQAVVQDGRRVRLGDFEAPADPPEEQPTFIINFAGPAHTIPTRSIYQVLDGTIPRDFLKDKVVFIGADLAAENQSTGPGTDRFPTPVDVEGVLMPGVEIHANAFNTLLTRSFIRIPPPVVLWSVILFLALLTTAYCTWLRPVPAGIATGATVLVSAFAVYFIFAQYSVWLPSVRPTVLIGLIYVGNTVAQYRMALRERAQISKAFKHYVSAEVLGELMKNPENLELGGREVEATVMFTDIAGFSKISERISPQELTRMLNQYFELLAGVIMREGGMVNKFIGDAVMAIWGVPLDNPHHAVQACLASMQIHRAMVEMAPVTCRIGLNTGKMIAGNMGSRERFEYTVIGDTVNLASRLEGVNKLYHTDVMISEMTEENVRDHFLLREVDSIRVVGKERPVRIFQLLDSLENRGAPEHQRWSEMTGSFLKALDEYRRKNWLKAAALFQDHRTAFPEDDVGRIYMERCLAFVSAPPAEDWDGVFQMETK